MKDEKKEGRVISDQFHVTSLLVYVSTCLLVYLSTCFLVYLSTCLLVYLFTCLLVYASTPAPGLRSTIHQSHHPS